MKIFRFLVLFGAVCGVSVSFTAPLQGLPREIVLMRHGDKDPSEDWNHNLDAAGLKRSLALPQVLLGRYGKPDAIFAPQPKAPNGGNIRSIQLITPTAVEAQVNIDTAWGVGDEAQLAQQLSTDPALDGKLVFVVWEHKAIPELAKALGIDAPKWKSADFDSLWILTNSNGHLVLSIDKEGLGK
jgi:hypothetical protein